MAKVLERGGGDTDLESINHSNNNLLIRGIGAKRWVGFFSILLTDPILVTDQIPTHENNFTCAQYSFVPFEKISPIFFKKCCCCAADRVDGINFICQLCTV